MTSIKKMAALILGSALALTACSSSNNGAEGGDWPADRVTVSVPLSAGGGTDVLARKFATEFAEVSGADVVVENNPGAGTVTGLNQLHGADADGSQLMIIGTTIASVKAAGQSEFTYEDFTVLGLINADPAGIAVRGDAPWQTIEEFVADIRAEPNTIRVSTANPQGVWDIVANLLMEESDLPWRPIPTEGGAAPAVQALLSNEVEAVLVSPPEMIEHVKAGTVRVLAVGSEERLPFLDGVPTFGESGLYADPPGTFRPVLGPPNMPDEIADAVAAGVLEVAESSEFQEWQAENWLNALAYNRADAETYLQQQQNAFTTFLETVG